MPAPQDSTAANGDTFHPLFVIERSTNANVVHYEARVSPRGRLVADEPVIVYWRMHTKDGRREPLNSIEKKQVYGVTAAPLGDGASFHVTIAAEPAREIRVFMENGVPRADTLIGGRRAYLQRLYISTGKLNIFHINYIDLFGVDEVTGNKVQERLPK